MPSDSLTRTTMSSCCQVLMHCAEPELKEVVADAGELTSSPLFAHKSD